MSYNQVIESGAKSHEKWPDWKRTRCRLPVLFRRVTRARARCMKFPSFPRGFSVKGARAVIIVTCGPHPPGWCNPSKLYCTFLPSNGSQNTYDQYGEATIFPLEFNFHRLRANAADVWQFSAILYNLFPLSFSYTLSVSFARFSFHLLRWNDVPRTAKMFVPKLQYPVSFKYIEI